MPLFQKRVILEPFNFPKYPRSRPPGLLPCNQVVPLLNTFPARICKLHIDSIALQDARNRRFPNTFRNETLRTGNNSVKPEFILPVVADL